jgi:glycosyltransferase involved in cell wall biosynthesis
VKVLFLNQGRPRPEETIGLRRVRDLIEAGLPHAAPDVEATFVEIPPFNRWHRRLMRPVKRWDRLNLQSLRWHLVRSWQAREIVLDQEYLTDPDVVHVTTSHVGLLLSGIQRRLPCVLSMDTLVIDWARMKRWISPVEPTPAYLKALEPLERNALHAAPLNIAWTETVATRVREFAPKANVTALHPGLDLEAFRPNAQRAARGPVRVLFVGGRWKAKGGPQLLEALGPWLGREVTLDVVTQEPVEARDGVELHEAQPGSSLIHELFARADIFCLPTFIDAVPIVALEAMASGVPVVASRVGSIPELLGDGGLTTEPGDVAGLRNALGALIEDRSRARELGEAGRARAEACYDVRVTTPRLIELLRGVAEGNAA